MADLLRSRLTGAVFIRATFARRSNPDDLIETKYRDIPEMAAWIRASLPEEFVWIEDTFADLERQARGNLRNRGATLLRIASYFDELPVVTRTINPAVVAATLRDAGTWTKLYVGTASVDADRACEAAFVGGVPDRRTVLEVDYKQEVQQ